MKLLSFVKKHLEIILLGLILITLFVANYSWGTYLIGWDNIMPELDIWLNLKRSFFAVWQEYQGLGLVGGMAHATDLIRQIILLPFVLLLPDSLIRYLWHYFLLALGTFGVYFGLKNYLKLQKSIPLVGSLFYLLNFGTVQYFWVPLESFSAFWGFFPWLIFGLWQYLEVKDVNLRPVLLRKLILLNFFAIPAFYVQTIFIVYVMCLCLILLAHFLTHITDYRSLIANYFKIFALIIAVNSFWLLPLAYFTYTNLSTPVAGIGNFMSSEESFARNQKRGYISDFLLLRGYYYDFPDSGNNFLAPWHQHFSNDYIVATGYLLAGLVITGLVYAVIRSQKFHHLSVILIFLLTASALLSTTPPFNLINNLLRQNYLLNQIFRAPFTKFIVPAIFAFTLLLSFGLNSILTLITKLKYPSAFKLIFLSLIGIFIITFSFPAFKGDFLYSKMRQKIPSEYFQAFDYFQKNNSTGRIANLPQGSFWGWTNYRNSIHGSGFIWYGIDNPILDRAFDAWNLKNEQYYWELSTALNQRNPELLAQIFSKYSIEYVLFDDNVFFPDEKIYSKISLSTKNLLPLVPGLVQDAKFGPITIYKFHQPTLPYLITNPPKINYSEFYYIDTAFANNPDYISSDLPDTSYPFANLFTNRLQNEIPYNISLNSQTITITTRDSKNSYDTEASIFYNHSRTNSPLIENYQQYLIEDETKFIRLTDNNSQNVIAWNFPTATFDRSYLVKIDYRHISGLPLTVSANSENLNYRFFYTRLNKNTYWQTAWFIIPKMENYDFSQSLNIIVGNSSLNYLDTVNDIKTVEIFPVDLDAVVNLDLPPIDTTPSSRQYLPFSSSIFLHKIPLSESSVQNSDSNYLVLPQSYSDGWLAFYLDGLRPVFLPGHTTANSWANAWEIPSSIQNLESRIYILFWPQLLQFLGFGFLITAFIWLFHIQR